MASRGTLRGGIRIDRGITVHGLRVCCGGRAMSNRRVAVSRRRVAVRVVVRVRRGGRAVRVIRIVGVLRWVLRRVLMRILGRILGRILRRMLRILVW